jgi:hypothetical protein
MFSRWLCELWLVVVACLAALRLVPSWLAIPHFGFHCLAEPFVALYVRTWSLELGVLSGDTEPVTHPTHAPASRDEG